MYRDPERVYLLLGDLGIREVLENTRPNLIQVNSAQQ